jgi:hypothetical protein
MSQNQEEIPWHSAKVSVASSSHYNNWPGAPLNIW